MVYLMCLTEILSSLSLIMHSISLNFYLLSHGHGLSTEILASPLFYAPYILKFLIIIKFFGLLDESNRSIFPSILRTISS